MQRAPLLLPAPSPRREYIAYRTTEERTTYLTLRQPGIAIALRYRDLYEVGYDVTGHDEAASGFAVASFQFYPRRLVTITGRNLRPVINAIARERCSHIYERDAELIAGGADAPVIDNIQIGRFHIGSL